MAICASDIEKNKVRGNLEITCDVDVLRLIDPFHLQAYGQTTVDCNRDVEIFPVLSAIFEKILGSCPYQVPHRHGGEHGGQLHCRRRGMPRRLPYGDPAAVLHRENRTGPG